MLKLMLAIVGWQTRKKCQGRAPSRGRRPSAGAAASRSPVLPGPPHPLSLRRQRCHPRRRTFPPYGCDKTKQNTHTTQHSMDVISCRRREVSLIPIYIRKKLRRCVTTVAWNEKEGTPAGLIPFRESLIVALGDSD